MEYIIVGDSGRFKGSLIYTCGTEERAKEVLEQMLNNPNENDLKVMEGHTNIRIEAINKKDAWWLQGGLD